MQVKCGDFVLPTSNSESGQRTRRTPGPRASEMTMEPQREPLYLAQAENRHLQETIRLLRDELERVRHASLDDVRQADRSAHNNILQLQHTIATLRDELEQMQLAKEADIQQAIRSANNEILQLQETVTVLRDELERTTDHYETNMRELDRHRRDEIYQLQQTIRALRDQLGEKSCQT